MFPKVEIGTSGWVYRWWAQVEGKNQLGEQVIVPNFYPNKTCNLKYYAQHFQNVEINVTRYKKLDPEVCKKWVMQTPSYFTFILKAPLYITHYKKLTDFQDWWLTEFVPCLEALNPKLSCILFQFHHNFHLTKENVKRLKNMQKVISKTHKNLHIAIEFRHISFYPQEQSKLSQKLEKIFLNHNYSFVYNHIPFLDEKTFGGLMGTIDTIMPTIKHSTKKLYFRFHGPLSFSVGTYGYEYLKKVVDHALSLNPEKLVFALNNTDSMEPLEYRDLLEESVVSKSALYVVPRFPPSGGLASCLYDCMILQKYIEFLRNKTLNFCDSNGNEIDNLEAYAIALSMSQNK
jgi:uncharacterized protein YecE (DUF72 family)